LPETGFSVVLPAGATLPVCRQDAVAKKQKQDGRHACALAPFRPNLADKQKSAA